MPVAFGPAVAVSWVVMPTSFALFAGMPAPLPADPERVFRLGDTAALRLQTISFFLLVFLLCVAAVWGLWKYLRRDFPALGRLSFGRAAAAVLLWGLLFVVVLTMISGARELMTPGAWRKQDSTYSLDVGPGPPAESASTEAIRRRYLEQLRTALWQFAATHNGRFPSATETNAIPSHLWVVPGGGGLRYQYVPDRSAGFTPDVLVYEPELDVGKRLVLRVNGDIVLLPTADLRDAHGRLP